MRRSYETRQGNPVGNRPSPCFNSNHLRNLLLCQTITLGSSNFWTYNVYNRELFFKYFSSLSVLIVLLWFQWSSTFDNYKQKVDFRVSSSFKAPSHLSTLPVVLIYRHGKFQFIYTTRIFSIQSLWIMKIIQFVLASLSSFLYGIQK